MTPTEFEDYLVARIRIAEAERDKDSAELEAITGRGGDDLRAAALRSERLFSLRDRIHELTQSVVFLSAQIDIVQQILEVWRERVEKPIQYRDG